MKIYYRKLHKYKYQLTKKYNHKIPSVAPDLAINFGKSAYVYISAQKGAYDVLYIKKGYCWDGPSGPTCDTKNSMQASLVHDALYQLIRTRELSITYRKVADDLFFKICLEDGMRKWRAWIWYQAVKHFAHYAAKPGSQQDKTFSAGRE